MFRGLDIFRTFYKTNLTKSCNISNHCCDNFHSLWWWSLLSVVTDLVRSSTNVRRVTFMHLPHSSLFKSKVSTKVLLLFPLWLFNVIVLCISLVLLNLWWKEGAIVNILSIKSQFSRFHFRVLHLLTLGLSTNYSLLQCICFLSQYFGFLALFLS